MKNNVFIIPDRNNGIDALLIKAGYEKGKDFFCSRNKGYNRTWENLEPEIKSSLEDIITKFPDIKIYGISLNGSNPYNAINMPYYRHYDLYAIDHEDNKKSTLNKIAEIINISDNELQDIYEEYRIKYIIENDVFRYSDKLTYINIYPFYANKIVLDNIGPYKNLLIHNKYGYYLYGSKDLCIFLKNSKLKGNVNFKKSAFYPEYLVYWHISNDKIKYDIEDIFWEIRSYFKTEEGYYSEYLVHCYMSNDKIIN